MNWHIGYVSVAEKEWTPVMLNELESQACELNKVRGVTGLLVFDGTHFFQYLEGDRNQVEAVYKRIEKDSRHHSVTKLSAGEVKDKLFSNWAMKLFLPENFNMEDRVHILDILSHKHEKESLHQILGALDIYSESNSA